MKMLLQLLVVLVIMLGLKVSAHAILIDNLDGTITDTETNLMWLQDANYAYNSGYTPISGGYFYYGLMEWHDAVEWADNLIFASYDDWRLPHGDTSCIKYSNCESSEMGNLYHVEGISYNNPGPFINLQNIPLTGDNPPYWTGTGVPNGDNPISRAYYFSLMSDTGYQSSWVIGNTSFAWGVRDISSIPEPSTLLLLGSGLVGLGLMRQKITS